MFDPSKHHRRSIRLKGYDYTQSGVYFVTVCVQDRSSRFGEVVEGEMVLNDAGRMVWEVWGTLPTHYGAVELDTFIVMPNHLHGLFALHPDRSNPVCVGEVVGGFKSLVTVEYIRGVKKLHWPPFEGRLLQRDYYEHIVRDDESLDRIREYIQNNPAEWDWDAENPNRVIP